LDNRPAQPSHPARPAQPRSPAQHDHGRPGLGIGAVYRQLLPEFPDVTISKIRFLETEGLIEPARSPSGYRRFGPADVDRLRYILTVQRDYYLPLRVIKEQLARPAPGPQPDPGPAGGRDGPPERRPLLLSRRELLEVTGIGDGQLAELEEQGLIRRTGRQYGQDALAVAGAVAALAAYGVQARHLRAARAAAEREISLIEQVVAPTLRQRNPGAREAASRTAREIAALNLRLHAALVENALAEAGLPAPAPVPPAEAADGRPAQPRRLPRREAGGATA
jgi:DNA-binding transcriptional MerR regulator